MPDRRDLITTARQDPAMDDLADEVELSRLLLGIARNDPQFAEVLVATHRRRRRRARPRRVLALAGLLVVLVAALALLAV